jgi:hypothetical protein
MVAPLPRTRFVPDNAETTPAVAINVPAKPVGSVTVPVNVGEATVAYVACVVVEPSAFRKLVAKPALEEITPDPLFNSTPAVVNEDSVGTEENVCVPVNVCAASVLAIVALEPGNVIVVPSVPVNVTELLAVRLFPEATILAK